MKIGIDGYEANVEKRVGIGQFAYCLLWGLYGLNTRDEFVVFVPNKKTPDLPKERKGWQYRVIPSKRFWTFTSLPKALKQESLDVFFSPTHYVPFRCKISRIFSIMDLSYIQFPSLFRKKDLLQLRLGTAHSIKVAKQVVTISQFSKNAIIDQYGIDSKKVTIAYPGFNKDIFNTDIAKKQIKKTEEKYRTGKEYIIYVGTLQPRKNIVRLLGAFQKVKNRETKLLIIGKKGWLYNEIFESVENLELTDRVVFTGFIENKELAALIAGALCFVLPSLYEGFGIPAIEAMACGVPVVVSNVSSLPEIVGKSGIYVDPYNVDDIARGIMQVQTLSEKQREKIVVQSLEHIQKFTWENCAKKVLRAIKEAA